mmetsp:Transcript_28130/g.23606  ORF Transcript_28130/g.23606 Transcript_28130/m.23606 type:complete len:158 (-) Transcript_28130:775-1248(-)
MASDQLKLKDMKIIKVIHDIKNPVQALVSSINDFSLTVENMHLIANQSLEDITGMLENLRIEFKSRHRMDLKEERRDVQTVELLENITRAHIRLAKNGLNHFKIEVDPLLPKYIMVATISFSRVCHNLISNALKHTYRGTVEVNLKKPSLDDFDDHS